MESKRVFVALNIEDSLSYFMGVSEWRVPIKVRALLNVDVAARRTQQIEPAVDEMHKHMERLPWLLRYHVEHFPITERASLRRRVE